MNLLEVGALLKKERERSGITVRDVMDATKISRRNLTALEDGQLDALPHPVYLKGYVRNIAKLVGLDADQLARVVDQQYDTELAKYLPQNPAVQSQAEAPRVHPGGVHVDPAAPLASAPSAPPAKPEPAPRPAPEPEREARTRFTPESLTPPKPKRPGVLRSAIVLVLLVGTLVGLLVQYQRMYTPPPPPPPAAEPQPVAPNATAPDNASESLDNVTDNATQTAAPEAATVPAAPEAAPAPAAPAKPEAPRAAALQPAQAAPATATPSVPATSIEVSRKTVAAQAQPAPAAAPTPGMQQVTITAKADEACWVQVSEGQQVKSFTLRKGESRQVEFSKRLRVRLGNAGGVSFRLNGRDYPYEGKRGGTDTVEFGER